MTAEALANAPETLFGSTPQSPALQIFELPPHLTRENIQHRQRESGFNNEDIQKLWAERGVLVERKVQSIIASQTEIVKRVLTNPAPDTEGPDLTVEFVEGFPVEKVFIEVKSSSLGIKDYKTQIRDSLPEGQRDMEHVRLWMSENNIILINGGEKDKKEKTSLEILNASFYPQLERIKQRVLAEQDPQPDRQLVLFPEPKQIQIFPEGF